MSTGVADISIYSFTNNANNTNTTNNMNNNYNNSYDNNNNDNNDNTHAGLLDGLAQDGLEWREVCAGLRARVRPISLLRLSLPRFVDSRFREIPHGHENSTP